MAHSIWKPSVSVLAMKPCAYSIYESIGYDMGPQDRSVRNIETRKSRKKGPLHNRIVSLNFVNVSAFKKNRTLVLLKSSVR